MGRKAKTWNRLRDTLKRSQLKKARKDAEKVRKKRGQGRGGDKHGRET